MAGSNELAAQLGKLAEQMGMQLTPKGGGGSWAGAPPAIEAPFVGVSIPINVETPLGKVRCYLSLPAEAASSAAALQEAIKRIADMGLPVDAFRPNNGGGGYGGGAPRQPFNGPGNGTFNRRW